MTPGGDLGGGGILRPGRLRKKNRGREREKGNERGLANCRKRKVEINIRQEEQVRNFRANSMFKKKI